MNLRQAKKTVCLRIASILSCEHGWIMDYNDADAARLEKAMDELREELLARGGDDEETPVV